MSRSLWLAAVALGGAGAVGAISAYAVPSGQSPPTAVDLSGYAATSAIPQPCGTVPSADTLNGTVGSGNCYTRPTDTRPTVVQAGIITTDASGSWTITWAKAFNSATPYINPQPINPAGSAPYTCNVSSSTTTSASGKCWMAVSISFPALFTTIANTVQQTFGIAPSISVRVAARDTTQ